MLVVRRVRGVIVRRWGVRDATVRVDIAELIVVAVATIEIYTVAITSVTETAAKSIAAITVIKSAAAITITAEIMRTAIVTCHGGSSSMS